MAKKEKMLTAIFRDRVAASNAFNWLLNRGYRSDEINVLMTDKTRATLTEREAPIKAGSKAAEGVAAGGAVGTAVGAGAAALAALGTFVVVPGVGWVVAGPLFMALVGGGAGAVAGGAIGGLIGLGISESNATAYEEALREGGIVFGVVPHNNDEASAIEDYFEKHAADNIVYA